MALIFIALTIINNSENNFDLTNSSSEILKYDFDNCFGVYAGNRNDFFFCSKNSIKFLNENGQGKWSVQSNFSAPIICHNKKILGISDLKTNIIYVYDTSGQLYSIKSDGKLLAFSVNQLGFCSTISKENDLYKINVYNTSGEKILTYVHSEENIFPVNSNISPDGKILAVSYIDVNNINIDSKIIFMHTNQDDIFASVHEKNNFVYGLNFLSNNVIILAGEKQIVSESLLPGNLKEQWRLKFDSKISEFSFNNNFMAVKFDNDNFNFYSRTKSLIKFFSMSGKQIGEFKSSDLINFIEVGDKFDNVLIGSLNDFFISDQKGEILWKHSLTGECRFAVFLNKPNRILAISPAKVFVLNIRKGEH